MQFGLVVPSVPQTTHEFVTVHATELGCGSFCQPGPRGRAASRMTGECVWIPVSCGEPQPPRTTEDRTAVAKLIGANALRHRRNGRDDNRRFTQGSCHRVGVTDLVRRFTRVFTNLGCTGEHPSDRNLVRLPSCDCWRFVIVW
jgi:hypothetical protein